MGDPTLDFIAKLQSMQGGSDKPGSLFGMIPNADTTGGFQLIVVGGVLKGTLNTPISALANSGRFGGKGGQQAALAKFAATVSSDFQKANQAGESYKAQLAAGVEAAGHGLPRDVGKPSGGGLEV